MGLVSEKRSGGYSGLVSQRSRRRGYRTVAAVLGGFVLLVAVALGLLATVGSGATVSSDQTALAGVGMPFDGGTITSVLVFGANGRVVPVQLRGDQIWPQRTIKSRRPLTIDVTIKRPGWISWLAGATQHLKLTTVTPAAGLSADYLTLRRGAPLQVHFTQPVAAVSYGPAQHALTRHVFGAPTTEVTLPRSASAGTIWVAGVPRTWETTPAAALSWFPGGAVTAAVASPAPGGRIGPTTSISLTFSKTVQQALGSSRPPVSPTTAGSWQQVNSHTIVFHPQGYGYGLGAKVTVGLPAGVEMVGGHRSGSADNASWTVPAGSTVRLQQVLAGMGYLPLRFNYADGTPPANTPQTQEAAAIRPPKGTFSWRYGNVPGALRSDWAPGSSGVMTQGAIMAFENDEGMTADGVAGPAVWKALLAATVAGHKSTFGYTFVTVSEGSPETESTWHNGHTVASGLVNTGIPATPTALGTFTVFEHSLSVTMEGTNADGSHYDDPGVPYVSYFNGGDALHGFIRASYGYPQSDGCVEMPYSEAESVYPYTPIGTLVNVT